MFERRRREHHSERAAVTLSTNPSAFLRLARIPDTPRGQTGQDGEWWRATSRQWPS